MSVKNSDLHKERKSVREKIKVEGDYLFFLFLID